MNSPTDEITIRIVKIHLDSINKDYSVRNIKIQLAEILKQSIYYGISQWKDLYREILLILAACLKVSNQKAYNAFMDFVFDDLSEFSREEAEVNIQEIVNNMVV